VLKPKRIVGLTGPGVARIEDDAAGGAPIRSGLDGAGDVIIGLNPALPSSVAPSGIPPLPTGLPTPPPTDGVVPDAVPVVGAAPQLIAPELRPEGMTLEHGLLLAVGSNGAGLSPLGDSEVAPSGIPTGPTGDVAPGIPSGDVGPIAGLFGESGASWAKLAPQPRSNIAEAINEARNIVSIQLSDR